MRMSSIWNRLTRLTWAPERCSDCGYECRRCDASTDGIQLLTGYRYLLQQEHCHGGRKKSEWKRSGNEQYIALIRFDLADLINVEVVSASMCFTPSEQQELNVNASWQISRIQNDWNAELGWAGLGVLGDPADVKNVEVVILNEVCVDVTEIVQSGSNERVNYGFRIESLAGAQGTVALKSSESAGGGGPLLKLSYRTR